MTLSAQMIETQRFMRDLCGGGTLRGHGYRVDAPTPRAGRYPMGSVEERVALAGQVFEADLRQWELIGDDRVPWLHVWSGTEVFAAAFGSRVHYVGEAMPFALPAVCTAKEADRLAEPDIQSGPLGEMFAIGDRLVARYGEDYPLQICDIQSPLDIAALIWEKVAFYAALVEEPEAVHRLVSKVCNTLERFVDEWKRRYRNACLVHYPRLLDAARVRHLSLRGRDRQHLRGDVRRVLAALPGAPLSALWRHLHPLLRQLGASVA